MSEAAANPSAAADSKIKPGLRMDPGYINAMSHFYRGELARIMVWRQRLDTTTSWAITVTSSIFTVAFSFRDLPHVIFFFNIAVVAMLLWIEARRYRFYDAFRARVRMLEAHFLVPIVSQNSAMLHGEWQRLVCEDLLLPAFKISMFEALGRRLKRNYVFIFVIICVAWITKIFLHADPKIDSFSTFYINLHAGSFPSWLVAIVFLGTMASVVGIVAYIGKKTSGEVGEFGGHRSAWRI
jgi:uncharacterized membrane protein